MVKVDTATPPAGYTQTGDPDHFGTTGTNDNTTTTPIVLGPGDVFVNADFGYQPTTSASVGSIGDTVWVDADRQARHDASEHGIAGVTVALIKDLDGDGTWDAGEPIIATDITDDNPATGVIPAGTCSAACPPTARKTTWCGSPTPTMCSATWCLLTTPMAAAGATA